MLTMSSTVLRNKDYMKLTTVLFDLDGTLLPMDQEEFTKKYMQLLCRRFVPLGYDQEKLVKSVWHGLKAMVTNRTDKTNEIVFWDCFQKEYGSNVMEDQNLFYDFYLNDFQEAAEICHPTSEAKKAIDRLHDMGLKTVVATLPAFPRTAIISRIRWTGLSESDFEYITSYENCTRCKPDAAFYSELLEHIGRMPEECIMVGNNVDEDMIAESIGIQGFLMPECLINEHGKDISTYPQGDFIDLVTYIEKRLLL